MRDSVEGVAEPASELGPRDSPELERERHDLLREDVRGPRRRHDRLHDALPPEGCEREAGQELLVVGGEEEAVPRGAGPPPGPAHALEEGGNTWRGADLDDAVEIADVEAQLERRRGDDDAIGLRCEGRLGLPALVQGERGMRNEGADAGLPQARRPPPRPCSGCPRTRGAARRGGAARSR